ncbi:MAG TPA: tetratricopeptide repeat protein [Candidatus Acidoferrales bacterium]|nr:tetratricopeptide repeat protein [Candidatus Acidoferrales bacterium]
MAQHISRKELKKDEVRETFAHGAEAVLSHRQFSSYVVAVAVVIALGVFGWRTYSQHQTVKAFAAFDAAMKVFQSPIGAPQAPGEVTYADENKKYTEANQKFSDVASKYPRTRAGELASYYSALSLQQLNKNDDAKKRLQALASSKDADVAAMAQFQLAALDDNQGQGDEAVKLYQQLIAKPTALVPKPVVMLALANHYSQKDPSQAAKLYTQIKSDYPDTPIAEQADQALALLPGKS